MIRDLLTKFDQHLNDEHRGLLGSNPPEIRSSVFSDAPIILKYEKPTRKGEGNMLTGAVTWTTTYETKWSLIKPGFTDDDYKFLFLHERTFYIAEEISEQEARDLKLAAVLRL